MHVEKCRKSALPLFHVPVSFVHFYFYRAEIRLFFHFIRSVQSFVWHAFMCIPVAFYTKYGHSFIMPNTVAIRFGSFSTIQYTSLFYIVHHSRISHRCHTQTHRRFEAIFAIHPRLNSAAHFLFNFGEKK